MPDEMIRFPYLDPTTGCFVGDWEVGITGPALC